MTLRNNHPGSATSPQSGPLSYCADFPVAPVGVPPMESETKPSILFVIDADPRTSGRPAEAIRIAAGVAVWRKVNVSVYLRKAAALILVRRPRRLGRSRQPRAIPVAPGRIGQPSLHPTRSTLSAGLGKNDRPIPGNLRYRTGPIGGPSIPSHPILMPRILHILTRPDDALPQEIIAHQKKSHPDEIEIADLRVPHPNYDQLLEKIFAADSIECW